MWTCPRLFAISRILPGLSQAPVLRQGVPADPPYHPPMNPSEESFRFSSRLSLGFLLSLLISTLCVDAARPNRNFVRRNFQQLPLRYHSLDDRRSLCQVPFISHRQISACQSRYVSALSISHPADIFVRSLYCLIRCHDRNVVVDSPREMLNRAKPRATAPPPDPDNSSACLRPQR